jgi:DNA-binding SARP family transcriptional activator
MPLQTASRAHIQLLGGFCFSQDGRSASALSEGSQRLFSVLALSQAPLTRLGLSGVLWPESSENHAYSCLRSALARLGVDDRDAMAVGQRNLGLARDVSVDIRDWQDRASCLLSPDVPNSECDLSAAAVDAFSLDLLPGWYEDWVLIAGEKWRQLRLHALEAIANRLARENRYGEALIAALAAVAAEPLRESAHCLLIRLHLGEGNQSEALKTAKRYEVLLRKDLGLEPTARLTGLVGDLKLPASSAIAATL